MSSLGSAATIATINEPLENVQGMGMMYGFGAYIEEVRGHGPRTIVVFHNIEAIRNHPLFHMLGIFVIRSLTSSTANVISRFKEDML